MRSENMLSEMVQFINSKNPENVWEMDKNDQSYLKIQGWGLSLIRKNYFAFLFLGNSKLTNFWPKLIFLLKISIFKTYF